MRIRTKLIVGFTVVSLLIVAVTGAAIYGFKSIKTAYQSISDESDVTIITLREIQFYFTGQANDERGFLLTQGKEFRQEIIDKAESVKKRLSFIEPMLKSEQEKALLRRIIEAHQSFTTVNLTVIDRYNAGNSEEAKRLSFEVGRRARKDLQTSFDELVKSKSDEIAQKKQQAESLASKLLLFILAVSGSAIAIGVLSGIYLVRSITKPIVSMAEHMDSGDLNFVASVHSEDELGQLVRAFDKMTSSLRKMVVDIQSNAEQVASSSEELTATSTQSSLAANQVAVTIEKVAHSSAKQSSLVQEAVHSTNSMTAAIKKVASDTSAVEIISEKTSEEAQRGTEAIARVVSQMENIEQTVSESALVVSKLGERSREIGEITNVIASIAGQTNLLALNAAIEAARAGENGRGFAVVAEEVRKLAEQSHEAAQKIAGLIGTIQSDTEQAVQAMTSGTQEVKVGTEVVHIAGQSFSGIAALVTEVSSKIVYIAESIVVMTERSEALLSTMDAVDIASKDIAAQTQTVSAATQEQYAAMEQVESFSQNLSRMAQELQAAVVTFKL